MIVFTNIAFWKASLNLFCWQLLKQPHVWHWVMWWNIQDNQRWQGCYCCPNYTLMVLWSWSLLIENGLASSHKKPLLIQVDIWFICIENFIGVVKQISFFNTLLKVLKWGWTTIWFLTLAWPWSKFSGFCSVISS